MVTLKIIIDAGHGGSDSGATGNGKLEKDLNLNYATKLRDILEGYNCIVGMTRTTDKTFELNDRSKWIHDQNADLVISCHVNAYDKKASGTETIFSKDAPERIEKLAILLGQNISKNLGIKHRRTFLRKNNDGKDYYCLHRQGSSNCIIIEPFFIDSETDLKKIYSTKNWELKLANTIAICIVTTFSLTKKNKPSIDWKDIIKAVDSIEYKDAWIKKISALIESNKDFENLPILIRKIYEA